MRRYTIYNYIDIKGLSLFASDVDGCEEAKVRGYVGLPLLHLLCLLDLLKSILNCLTAENPFIKH